MAPTMNVKPAAGLIVKDPVTRIALPDYGAEVPRDTYWMRRLRDGEVEETGADDIKAGADKAREAKKKLRADEENARKKAEAEAKAAEAEARKKAAPAGGKSSEKGDK